MTDSAVKRTAGMMRILACMLSTLWLASPVAARDVVRLPVPYFQQPDGSTCLPTSLCMALHFLGRTDLTSATIFQLHKTCRYDRYNVPDLVAQYGVYAFPSWLEHAWTRETVEAELRAGRPVVLGLDCSRAGHFVLAVGYTDDGKVIIHDPYWKEPGWHFGGPYVTTDWERLIWRNGIMVRGEPFPEPPRRISGTIVDTTAPRTLVTGQESVAEFAIKNNGKDPWPDGIHLAAVDAYTSPPRERESRFAILPGDIRATSGTWISETRAAQPDRKNLAPGEIAYFRVPLRAPTDIGDKPVVFRENFNLVDGEGKLFSEHWQTGPGNRQIFFRVAVVQPRPKNFSLPLVETVAGGKPSLPWRLKSSSADGLTVETGAPAFPESLAAAPAAENTTETVAAQPVDLPKPGTPVLRLRPAPGEEYESAFVGDPLGRDYAVEAWVYCEYKPADKAVGFDRSGIFLRDSGHHRPAAKTETESGECIVMAYDTDDGRVRAGNHAIGGMGDASRRDKTLYLKESGWHKFGIRAEGTTVTFHLDGRQIAEQAIGRNRRDPEINGAFSAGDCGVFCYSTYPDEADRRRGFVFADFKVLP